MRKLVFIPLMILLLTGMSFQCTFLAGSALDIASPNICGKSVGSKQYHNHDVQILMSVIWKYQY